jgi:hypothetical protein
VIEPQIARSRDCLHVRATVGRHEQAREQISAVAGIADASVAAGGDGRVRAPALDAPVASELRERYGNVPGIIAAAHVDPELKFSQCRSGIGLVRCRVVYVQHGSEPRNCTARKVHAIIRAVSLLMKYR